MFSKGLLSCKKMVSGCHRDVVVVVTVPVTLVSVTAVVTEL